MCVCVCVCVWVGGWKGEAGLHTVWYSVLLSITCCSSQKTLGQHTTLGLTHHNEDFPLTLWILKGVILFVGQMEKPFLFTPIVYHGEYKHF